MYHLVRTMSSVQVATRQGAVFAVAFVIATIFYKFGSFGLEAAAFLATWFVLDAVVEGVGTLVSRLREGARPATR